MLRQLLRVIIPHGFNVRRLSKNNKLVGTPPTIIIKWKVIVKHQNRPNVSQTTLLQEIMPLYGQ
jgi:hypothetical protein